MLGFRILCGCGLRRLERHLPGLQSQNQRGLNSDFRVTGSPWDSVSLSGQGSGCQMDGETSVGRVLDSGV